MLGIVYLIGIVFHNIIVIFTYDSADHLLDNVKFILPFDSMFLIVLI